MNQPMVMPPNPATSTSHNPLGAAMDSGIMNQNNVAQGVQFMRKIQLRISEIEQKLATPMSDTDRQSLQRAHQELTRLQATLMQKISQGIQTPASQTPNMLPSMHAQSAQNFSPSKFANAMPTNLGSNMPTNQPGSIPPGQPSMPILTVQQGQVPNISITPEQFKRTLSELMRRHGKSLPAPIVDGREVDLYYLFTTVQSLGGSKSVTQKNMWSSVSISLGFISVSPTQQASIVLQIAQVFKTYLELFEDVWNRAMLHQLSMGRSNSQMVNTSNRTESTAMKPMTQSQAPQPRPSNYGVMPTQQATQPQSQQNIGRVPLPFTKEQLSSLNLTYEQMAQFLQQGGKSFGTSIPQNPNQHGTGSQTWSPAAPHANQQRQARAMDQSKQQQNESQSPGKQRWKPLKVTPKMLEDAESLIHKIELSLNVSRPKLPVIETMTEAEKETVFQQVERLIPLNATVSALLPAFLAMSGNIEPAKRVKIMVYMFEDQLALLHKRQCILRPSDIEKLKIQMTRCIGFVRMNDDKLAQRIMAKVLASQQKEKQRRSVSDDPKRSDVFPESNKKAKSGQHSSQQSCAEVSLPDAGAIKTRAAHQKVGAVVSPTKHSSGTIIDLSKNNVKATTRAGSPGEVTTVDHAKEAVVKTLDKIVTDHQRNAELAQSDPLQFVQKAWNDLLSTEEATSKSTTFMENLNVDDEPIGDRQRWAPLTIRAAIMDMMSVPNAIQSSECDTNEGTMIQKEKGSIAIGSESVLQVAPAEHKDVSGSLVWDLTKPESHDQTKTPAANSATITDSDWWNNSLFASA